MHSQATCEGFIALAERLEACGCTDAEIERIRADQGQDLPASYECFLKHLGRDGGGLFGGSAVCYPDVLGLRVAALDLVREQPSSTFTVPDDAVVFWMHQGYQFMYLRGAEGHDPPIHHWTEVDNQEPTVVAPSLLALLEQELGSSVLPPDQAVSARLSTKAFRRLRYQADRCPGCDGEMAWSGEMRWESGEVDQGRTRMIATCARCSAQYWRWADRPSDPLQRRT